MKILGLICFVTALALIVMANTKTVGLSQVMTYPGRPSSVIVQDFREMYGIESDIKKFVISKVKEGYIVKSIAIIDDENWSKGVVVMEKY